MRTARELDATISMERANIIGAGFFPLALALVLFPFWIVWGSGPLMEGLGTASLLVLIPAMVLSVVLHEALHGVGFLLFGKAPRGSLHFGIDRQTSTPYAGCRAPVPARAYRAAVLLPALILGALPAVAGLIFGIGWLAIWGAFMLAVAGGDFLVLWAIRSVPANALVLDHPERVGCRVLGAESAS